MLEAWAGVPAQQALETARADDAHAPRRPLVSRAEPAAPAVRPPRQLAGGSRVRRRRSRRSRCGPRRSPPRSACSVVRDALVLALPRRRSAVQWALVAGISAARRGWPGSRRGAARCVATAALLVLGAATAFGRAGALAGLLIVTWTAGTLRDPPWLGRRVLRGRGGRGGGDAARPARRLRRRGRSRPSRRRWRGPALTTIAAGARGPGPLEPDTRRRADRRRGRRVARRAIRRSSWTSGCRGRARAAALRRSAPCGRAGTCGSSPGRSRARSPAFPAVRRGPPGARSRAPRRVATPSRRGPAAPARALAEAVCRLVGLTAAGSLAARPARVVRDGADRVCCSGLRR